VVVTGGAGFIGANLCRRLGNDELITEVVVLDDLSSGLASNLEGTKARLVEGTITDPDQLDEVFAGANSVVHLAAKPSVPRSIVDPFSSHRINTDGTFEVLEAARRAGGAQVIFASSSSVYGANPTLPKHVDLAPRPLSPYAAAKLSGESNVLAWRHAYDMPALAFRFFNVFGPLQQAGHAYAAVVPAFIDAALDGRPIPVHGDGSQSRDFTYVDTVADVIATAITERISEPQPVNLAFGSRTDLLGLISVIEDLLGRKLEREHTDPRAGDVPHSQADASRLHELFPQVEPVGLEQGVTATLDWFRTIRRN